MKLNFKFYSGNCGPIEKIIFDGIVGYATEKSWGDSISAVWLLLESSVMLKIQSKMQDIDEWVEVGALAFDCVASMDDRKKIVRLPNAWRNISQIKKMVIGDGFFAAESGIQITNKLGESLIVVASENPFQVEIRAPFFTGSFAPEYKILAYKLEDF